MAKQESFIVFGTNGMIDVDASKALFESELDRQVAFQEELHRAVEVIFNRYPDNALKIDPFVRLVLNQMEIDPFKQGDMEEFVMNYIRNSSAFKVSKGPSGGVRRLSDIKPNEKK